MRGRKVLGVFAFSVALSVVSSVCAQTVSEPVYRHVGFTRGDVNGDGTANIGDAFSLLGSLFFGTGAPTCAAAADVDANARLDVSDGIFLMTYLSANGDAPLAPFPGCAAAATGGLGCAQETCPEAVGRSFTLFGESFEADSVVFAIGRSPMMMIRRVRAQLAEELRGAIAGLPPGLPFDIVYFDGEKGATLSSTGSPSVLLSTDQEAVDSQVNQLFDTRPPGDDLEALFATATECARRGTGDRVVIYLGDGWDVSFGEANFSNTPSIADLQRVLQAIRVANSSDPVAIHTIGVHKYRRTLRDFMQYVAARNDGTYTSGGTLLIPAPPWCGGEAHY